MEAEAARPQAPARNTGAGFALLAVTALLIGACSTPAYPPQGRTSVASGPASSPARISEASPSRLAPGSSARDTVPVLQSRKERWWPEWSDPANWFLDEQYRL